ncbi:MAG: protein kinase [Gammaproteobacteria bacterium]|nr:protein kinase [Gammaproteobacteria bacterium]
MRKILHPNALEPGHKINWYEITDILGVGGFGITYLARDENLLQPVAIKEYFPREWAMRLDDGRVECSSIDNLEDYQWGMDRFISEGRILAKYDHPAIVRVMSVFEANKTAYLVMRYEEGATLKQVLNQTPELDEGDLKTLLRSLLDGLEKMHESGVIHRDIKPDNIFLRHDGVPVLLDFGSARQAIGEKTMDLTTIVSAGYAPIEQYARDEGKQGPWTDIYGLAATVYRAIVGNAPPDALVRSNALINVSRDVIPSLADEKMDKYSYRFLKAIDHALSFKANGRPQSIAAWREELRLGEEREVKTEENKSFVAASGIMNVEVDKIDTGQWDIENVEKKSDSAGEKPRATVEDDYGHIIGDLRKHYYKLKFKALAARRLPLSWNWAAGFFTWLWLLYRKMYLWGFLIYPVFAAVLFLLIDYSVPALFGPASRTPVAVLGGYFLITTLLGGAFGNALYRRHLLKKIRWARDLVPNDYERGELLRLKGGVTFLVPILTLMALAVAMVGFAFFIRGA